MVDSIAQQSTQAPPAVDADLWSEPKLREAIELWNVKQMDQMKLRALHTALKDIHHSWNDPHVVLGFAASACGTSYDFRTVETRFRDMIQWRIDNKVDDMLEHYKPNPLLLDNSPISFLKDYDSDGDPIYLERGGALDVAGLLKRFPRAELMRHAIWLREVQSSGAWVDEYERRQGKCIRNITVVYDLQGLCARHLQPSVLSFFQEFMSLTEAYYPGPIKRMIVIRSPFIFQMGWQTIKHFFSEESRDKMIFADSDHLSVLAKYMDINVLPNCINPNAHGETAVGMPKRMGCVPIPDHVGNGGAGYMLPDSGISEAFVVPTKEQNTSSASSSVCSSTDEETSSQGEEEELSGDELTLSTLRVTA